MTAMQMLVTVPAASKEEGATTTWRCPRLLPPPLVVLVVIVFDAPSLLAAMAPVDRGILLLLSSDIRQRDGDHGGGIPLTVRGYTANIGSLLIMLSMIAMSNGVGLPCIPLRRDFFCQHNSLSLLLPSLLIPPPLLWLKHSSSREEGGGAGNGWKTTAGTSREEEDNATSNDKYKDATGNSGFAVGA